MKADQMAGNPHYWAARSAEVPSGAHALTEAMLALAFEQRTANILAAQATPEWLNEARVRMGHEPFPPAAGEPNRLGQRDGRCNKPLMDGRNEIRCWGLAGHEGDCT